MKALIYPVIIIILHISCTKNTTKMLTEKKLGLCSFYTETLR